MRTVLVLALVGCGAPMVQGGSGGGAGGGTAEVRRLYSCTLQKSCRVNDGGSAVTQTWVGASVCAADDSEALSLAHDAGSSGCTLTGGCDIDGGGC